MAICLVVAPKTALSGNYYYHHYHHGLVVYDDFDGDYLDPDKWTRRQIDYGSLDVQRVIDYGDAHLGLRSYGETDFTGGRSSSRNRLMFPEHVGEKITTIKTTVTIKHAEVLGCDADTGTSSRLLVPGVAGYWFNDGTSSGPDDESGNMWAALRVRRDSHTSDPPGTLNVTAQLFHCGADPVCNLGTDTFFDSIGSVMVGDTVTLRVTWDKWGNQFIFQLNDDPEVVATYDSSLYREKASGYYKYIEVRGEVENCYLVKDYKDVRPYAAGHVAVEYVKINKSALYHHRRW